MKKIYFLILFSIISYLSWSQTWNPTAQTLPYSQNWGSASYTTMPAGTASWQGNGASITTQALAESSAPINQSSVSNTTPACGSTGGNYGDAPSSNARHIIMQSSNATNGANQLSIAVNTTGHRTITVSYDLFWLCVVASRDLGLVLQYRTSTSGSWTTVSGSAITTSGKTQGTTTNQSFTLPSNVENQSMLQIRFATWRANTSGASGAISIDNISVTSSVDGVITAGEYGTHTNGQNQQTNGATWLMTWDNNNLYLGWSGLANSGNGNNRRILMYFDVNPTVPVNGGTNADGNLTGFSYSNSQLGTLPFRSDCFLSLETGYRQLNTADGSGGWSAANTSYGVRAFGSSNDVAELAIPWSTITGGGGLPSSFNFVGYVTDGNGGGNYFYQIPSENPSGLIGTSIPNGGANGYERYYTVSTTTVGSSTPPFSQNSYVFNRNSDANGFGAISVFDFTMNTSGRNISRTGATSSNWTIANNMVLGNGIVYMGSGGTNGSYGTTTISGNLDIRGGELNLDQTTSPVIVNGNVSLSSGNLVLSGNGFGGGDLKVRGNWNYSGGTFTPNSRAVFFDGTTGDQTITGTTTFDNLTLDNSSGNLLLANPISVNQTLTLTNGKIVLGANDLSLSNAAPSSLSAGSATSYVVTDGAGALRRAIGTLYNGDYFFPVGNTSNRQLATVNFGSISANNTLAARFIAGASGNAGLPLTEGDNIARTASDGYWEINAASATGDTYTGTFVANGFTDITDFTKVHLLKRSDAGSAWALNGTHVTTTGSNALASLQRTGMSGFSQFAVGGESLISLPSVMLSFSGYKSGSVNKLNWTTVSEQNNRGFAVERSADGVNYAAIGFVNSLAVNGNSDASLTYSFTDANPTGSKQYYRLHQQDINGVSRLSNVIVIKGEKATALIIDGLYPNPVSSQLNVAVSSPVRGTVTLQVVDMTGRILSQQVKAISEGSNTVSVDVAGLSNGSYILKMVNAETGAVSTKFSKQ